jgi:hypothetical protein
MREVDPAVVAVQGYGTLIICWIIIFIFNFEDSSTSEMLRAEL